jgi:IS4 transposase
VARLDAERCRIVTRFRTNTPLVDARDMPIDPKIRSAGAVLSGRIGFLPKRQAGNRRNPMRNAVREIGVKIETGKDLRILTKDLDAPAKRWQIELFFRFVKQTLKIRPFVGRSENAVRIQIAVALIAFLLLRNGPRDKPRQIWRA